MSTTDPRDTAAETEAPAEAQNAHEATPPSDADLILRTRGGSADAFGELWRRHYRSGITVARSTTSSLDPDDLVQEAYARIYQAILKGGGPTGSFRAYLFTSIRNTAAGWGRARKETTIDELEAFEDPSTSDAATEEALDRSLTNQAFRSLPTRWQEVLWYTEIEQMKPSEVAPLLGMKATAVAQLAFRAREGLREAWVQAHLQSVEDGSDCQWTIERLGAHARENLGVRDRRKVDAHLADCARCSIVACEAKEVSNRLALVLLPLTVGVAGSAAYLASVQGGGAPIVALAMPASIVEGGAGIGAATAGAASAAGAGSAAGASGGASASGGGAAGAGAATAGAAAGGGFGGVGALVGIAAASVLIAGGVAAAAVLPGMLDRGTAAASSSAVQDAGDSAGSPIAPLIGPDPNSNTTITLPDNTIPDGPAPEERVPDAPAPDPEPRVPDAPAPPEALLPITPPTVEEEPGDTTPPTTDEPGTDEPGVTEPEVTEPGAEEPGTEEPGAEEPGTTEPDDSETPGTTDPDPGTTDPDNDADPGTDEPGTEEPGTEEPGATLPEGAPSFVGATTTIDRDWRTQVHVTLAGEAGATVRVTLDTSLTGSVTLDGTGRATVVLKPTAWELVFSSVYIAYTAGDEVGPHESIPLHTLILG